MPGVTDVQFQPGLTNVAIQYKNPELIGDLVLPPTPVGLKTDKFKKYDKDERFTLPDTKVGPKSEPNEVDFAVTEDVYLCEDHSLEEYVSNETIDNAMAPISPLADAAELVTDYILQSREKRVADAVFALANYDATNKQDIAGAWATLTNDVLTDIEAGIDQCFMPPNVMVMGIKTWRKVSRNTSVLAAVKGTLAPQKIKTPGGESKGTVNIDEFATYLGLDAVLIGRAQVNSSKKGQAASFKRVWDGPNAGKGGAALLRVKKGPAVKDVFWGTSFDWKGRQTFTFDSTRGAFGGKMVRVSESTVVKVTAKDVGYLFYDTLVT